MRWRNAPRGRRYTPEMIGMMCAHFGVAIFIAGVLIVEATSIEKDLRFAPNESVTIGALDFRFDGVKHAQGPNFTADEGTISVLKNGAVIATMNPQKRTVRAQRAGADRIGDRSRFVPRHLRRARRTGRR